MNKNIKKVLSNYKNFGFLFGTDFLIHKTILKKREWVNRKKAISILNKKFGYIFQKYSSISSPSVPFDKNIFVFWNTGFSDLPQIPKNSIDSIREYYPDYNIHYITLNNYAEYVKIDDNIINLFNKGCISIQTFSDILRFQLICKYGGVWCDATLIFYNRIDFEEELMKNSFYSLNINCKEKDTLWKKVYPITYTTFFFACKKGNVIMQALNEAFVEYYRKYDHVIDYFLNDYFFILAMMYKLDNDSLSKIPNVDGNPFYVLNSINNGITNLSLHECQKIPQKVTWKNFSMENINYV